MTNEQLFEDLRQLIEARASATEKYLEQRIDKVEQRVATKEDLKALEQRIDAKFDTVLDAVGERFDALDGTAKDHERRITRLEHHTA